MSKARSHDFARPGRRGPASHVDGSKSLYRRYLRGPQASPIAGLDQGQVGCVLTPLFVTRHPWEPIAASACGGGHQWLTRGSDYTRGMPTLRDHLDSPQFTDPDGESRGESVVGRVGGNWVKAGVPRWKAYLFYTIALLGGLGLIVTGQGELDLFAFFGIVCVGLAIFGFVETLRNRPFTKIFGGPVKPK